MLGSNVINGVFRPMQDWLLLAPEKQAEKVGGLHVPDAAQEFGQCPVRAAGPDSGLKVGDVVWMQRFVEGEFKFVLNGEPVYAIRGRHVNVALDKKGALRAVGDRILVKRLETKERKVGDIYIPESAAEVTQECEVVSVGPKGSKNLEVGQRVMIARYSGAEVRHPSGKFTVVNENDVIGALG